MLWIDNKVVGVIAVIDIYWGRMVLVFDWFTLQRYANIHI